MRTIIHGEEQPELALLRRIETIADTVRRGDSADAVLRGICTAIADTSAWPMCGVEVYAADDNRLLTWACSGFDSAAAELFHEWPLEADPSATAAQRNRIITIPDVSKAAAYPHTRREAIRTGFRSAVYVPIRLADRSAVLSLCRPDVRTITDAELAQAGMLAAVAAVAIESALKSDSRPFASNPVAAEHDQGDPRWLTAAQDRLLHLQVKDASLKEFCSAVAELLDKPVLLVDRFQQLLGAARLGREQTADLMEWLSGKRAVRDDGRGLVTLTDGPRRVVVGHCYDGPARLGSLVVLLPPDGHHPPPTPRAVELACVHLTLALLRQRAAIETEVRMRQEFGEALGSTQSSGLALSQAAAVLGIDMDKPLRVMRLHPEGLRRPLSSHDAFEVSEILAKRLAEINVAATVCPVGGVDLAIVLRDAENRPGTVTPAEVVRAGFREALTALRGNSETDVAIAIGIGYAGTGVKALDRSHREARRALEVARSMDGDEAERHIADVGSYAVLTATSAAAAADQELFVGRYLEPIISYDRSHGAGFIETLQAYFENVGNVQRTADQLYLHLSTVRYRLKRIEEIAHIDLRVEEDRLCLQLALRMIRNPAKTPEIT